MVLRLEGGGVCLPRGEGVFLRGGVSCEGGDQSESSDLRW